MGRLARKGSILPPTYVELKQIKVMDEQRVTKIPEPFDEHKYYLNSILI